MPLAKQVAAAIGELTRGLRTLRHPARGSRPRPRRNPSINTVRSFTRSVAAEPRGASGSAEVDHQRPRAATRGKQRGEVAIRGYHHFLLDSGAIEYLRIRGRKQSMTGDVPGLVAGGDQCSTSRGDKTLCHQAGRLAWGGHETSSCLRRPSRHMGAILVPRCVDGASELSDREPGQVFGVENRSTMFFVSGGSAVTPGRNCTGTSVAFAGHAAYPDLLNEVLGEEVIHVSCSSSAAGWTPRRTPTCWPDTRGICTRSVIASASRWALTHPR